MRHFVRIICIICEGGEMLSANIDKAEAAVRKYGDSLMRIAYTYTRNMEDAQDMVQEAFIKYLTKAPEFLSSEHEKAWLIRITINICKNHLASSYIKGRAELDENLSVCDEHSTLIDAVDSLPEKYRTAIHLFYYEGYSTKEIAKIIGLTESAVTSRLQRGRGLLKKMLGDDFG